MHFKSCIRCLRVGGMEGDDDGLVMEGSLLESVLPPLLSEDESEEDEPVRLTVEEVEPCDPLLFQNFMLKHKMHPKLSYH